MEGLESFYTRGIIPAVDVSLTFRGPGAITLTSRYNYVWFSRALASFPLFGHVAKSPKESNSLQGRLGAPKS